jgi:hypothetical protein
MNAARSNLNLAVIGNCQIAALIENRLHRLVLPAAT